MNLFTTPTRAVAVGVAAMLALTAAPAQAQDADDLVAVCTDENGALFRVDNGGDREFDFTLRQSGGDAAVSGSAYPIGRGGAFAYLPAGSTAELVVRGSVVATAAASGSACPSASADMGRPMCEGLRVDRESRQALFVGASEFRGVTEIEITVENGRVLVYDPHALFVIEAGGAPAPVFEVGDRMTTARTTATFDTGGELFNAGYGLLLQGNASGPVAFFATITSPGGVVECDPQFATSTEDPGDEASAFALDQNAPNPFGSSTEIAFTLEESGPVTLRVYDALGRRVATLVDGELSAGPHAVTWNGRGESGQPLASGTYIYRLDADGSVLTRRMTVVR